MRVTVRLFARLRELVGTGELVRDVPTGATVAQRLGVAGRATIRRSRRTPSRCRARSTPTTRA